MRTVSVLVLGVLVSGIPAISHADHVASSGLVISEVGFDTVAEGSATASSEYIEIYNPTSSRIALQAAAGQPTVYLSDAPSQYWKLPTGTVAVGSNSKFLWQFPAGATIAPHGFVVVCADSTAFLSEFYGGSLATFQALPGAPQLFEGTQDGTADGVPDMVNKSSTPTSAVLTNGGETVILFQWDGRSDLVQDLDLVVWQTGATAPQVTNKSGQSVDGPDADTTPSTYADDAAQTTSIAAGSPQTNLFALARLELHEVGEADTGGNGASGQDETSESFGAGSSWGYLRHSPGLPALVADASIADALSYLEPAAVSAADGPGSAASPADFGADGTLTELYVATADLDDDHVPESLYLAVRGDLFGEPDGDANASFVLLDLDPTESTGATNLASVDLTDVTGALDSRISGSGFLLDPAIVAAGGGFDAAVGMDGSVSSPDTSGWRGFGTGGATGTTGDFAFGPEARFQGDIPAVYPGAPGSAYAAPDGFEATIPLTTLAGAMPAYIRLVAVTTADTPGLPSPNTLPESAGDDFGAPHVLTQVVCYDVAAGRVVRYFVDDDHDGAGGTVATAYCGPPTLGLSTRSDDCDDADPDRHPGATELCNGLDDDCDGVVPANEADADFDTVRVCAGDCDDTRSDVSPLALEVCDGSTDEDCDGLVDDADPTATGKSVFFLDADGDGAGDPAAPVLACAAAPGRVALGNDCNDADPAQAPGLPEVCDPADRDEDCSGAADDADPGATGKTSFFADADGDGFGTGAAELRCDPAGLVRATVGGDCDDGASTVHPGAIEVCNGVDDDCDGAVPANEADADADGFRVCEGDCNDTLASVHPGAAELCNGADDDCDGAVPANEADADGDGFRLCAGDCNDALASVHPGAVEACNGRDDDCDGVVPADEADADADGARVCAGDCDDSAAGIHPGANEVCNGIDDNCDGMVPPGEADADGDGVRACAGDCNDADGSIRPGAPERCNGVDDDCDGMVDDNATDAATFFADTDGDGFGNPLETTRACTAPAGFVTMSGDCNDASAAIHPGATEVCNGVDDDCDLATDEGTQIAFYRDADGDGFGGTTQVFGCLPPAGFVVTPGDCDDGAPSVHPGALEMCNGNDDDCDGTVPADEVDGDADGVRVCANDCNDADPAIHPGVPDTPGDGIDQDCSGADATGKDADGDGFTDVTDCDDTDPNIHPGAPEVCDGKDTDCDPATDENADDDNDGFSLCTGDCALADPAVNPGQAELCNDVDDNCDGQVDEGFTHDGDGDGAENALCGGNDCDDSDATIHPGAVDEPGDGIDQDCSGADAVCVPTAENCTNGVDDDCDGLVDSDDPECVPPPGDGGCGCRVGGASVTASTDVAPGAAAGLLLLGVLALRGRRRRR